MSEVPWWVECSICVRTPVGVAMLRDTTWLRLCEEHWDVDLPIVRRHRLEEA